MKFGQRLKTSFLERVAASSNTMGGALFLDSIAPCISYFYDPIENSQSAQDYLEKIGYDPDVFKEFSEHPVRILSRDLGGFFSAVGLFKNSYELHGNIFQPYYAASLAKNFARNSAYQDQQFLIMPTIENFDYKTLLSHIALIPPKYLGDISGNNSALLATVLAHEIRHHSHDMDENTTFAYYLNAEVDADKYSFKVLNRIESEEVSEQTRRHIVHARGSGAIMRALLVRHNPEKLMEKLTHATSLMLDEHADYKAQDVMRANWAMVKLLGRYNRKKEPHIPYFIKTYQSANEILETVERLNPLQRLVLERYKQSIEFFCPVKAALALRPDQASSIMLLDNQGPH